MKNLRDILYFVIINIIMIFNVIPLMAAVFVAIIAGLIFSILHDNIFPAIILICSGVAIYTYILFLPSKLIIYPILYEFIDKQNPIFKLFDKCRTNKFIALALIFLLVLIDCIVYFYIPRVLTAYSPDDWIRFYKKSQLLGLTFCFLSLLLWFKLKNLQNNGIMLLKYYIVLTTLILVLIFIFKNRIIF